jgi:hypothetical protein
VAFATDKNTFYIREIATRREAISGYIIGVLPLRVQRFSIQFDEKT